MWPRDPEELVRETEEQASGWHLPGIFGAGDAWVDVTPEVGERHARLERPRYGLLALAYPRESGEAWLVRAWALKEPVPTDAETVRLAWACVLAEAPAVEALLERRTLCEKPGATSPVANPGKRLVEALHDVVWSARRTCDQALLSFHTPGVVLGRSYGGACPYQAFGTWNGYPFYFRYRGGVASLDVACPGEDAVAKPTWSASLTYGEPLSGFLEFSQFIYLVCALSVRLSEAPFLYEFRVIGVAEGHHEGNRFPRYALGDRVRVWAHSPQEACERTRQAAFDAYVLDATPLNIDDRQCRSADGSLPRLTVRPQTLAAAEALLAARPQG